MLVLTENSWPSSVKGPMDGQDQGGAKKRRLCKISGVTQPRDKSSLGEPGRDRGQKHRARHGKKRKTTNCKTSKGIRSKALDPRFQREEKSTGQGWANLLTGRGRKSQSVHKGYTNEGQDIAKLLSTRRVCTPTSAFQGRGDDPDYSKENPKI